MRRQLLLGAAGLSAFFVAITGVALVQTLVPVFIHGTKPDPAGALEPSLEERLKTTKAAAPAPAPVPAPATTTASGDAGKPAVAAADQAPAPAPTPAPAAPSAPIASGPGTFDAPRAPAPSRSGPGDFDAPSGPNGPGNF